MSTDLPDGLWKTLTSTIGLVAVRDGGTTNVMAAEWSYFVNKTPLYAAVVLGPRAATRQLLSAAGQFSLTFCAEDQAALADFVGSFSAADIDKSGSQLLRWGIPDSITSPWVTGGLLAVECVLRQTVEFPVHTMYVGEVVAAHLPQTRPRPLVKHDAMYTLGDRIQRTAVAAAAHLRPDRTLRVAATAPPAGEATPWQVRLHDHHDQALILGEYPCGQHGDLLVDIPLPAHLPAAGLSGQQISVRRDGADTGYATITEATR